MSLLDELHQRVLPADGAMGAELLAASAARGGCLEALCVSEPDFVRRVHQSYLAAGARLIRTNSFGANAARLATHGIEHHVSEINWTAAQLAKEVAAEAGAHVAGSVGPLGPGVARAHDLFLEQIGALLDGGTRVILLEGFTDLAEISIALDAKHTLHHCPVIACLTCREDGRLPDGTTLEQAFARLRDAGADVVGINRTTVTDALLAALPSPDLDLPLAMFAGAGLPHDDGGGRPACPVTPEQFARDALALAGRGARLLGGCCGTGPAHIAALSAALEPREKVE